MSAPPTENLYPRRSVSSSGGRRAVRFWSRAGKRGRRALVILAGLAVLIGVIWLLRPPPQAVHRGGRFGTNGPVPVGVAKTRLDDIRITLNALGSVTPLATVTIKPQVSGTLDKIDFREGQMVKAGDVLAEIDPRPYQAALDQAKGNLARDEAQLANAQTDVKRYQSLWAQKAISQQILATQEAQAHTDAGTVEADKGAVEAAAVNLSYCKITSPVAGRVGLRQVDVGNVVQVGSTPEIAVVTELQPMSVLFTLPEDDVGAVAQQLRAGATLPVDAYDRSQTTKLASGTLSTLDNEVDPTTGTVKLRALFDNADNRLFPSQFVNIRLLVDTLHKQITVPSAAIQHGQSGSYVFVVSPDRKARIRSVRVGPTDGDMVDVRSGLREGEIVVVDGADRLRDGSRVSVPARQSEKDTQGGHSGRRHRRNRSGQQEP